MARNVVNWTMKGGLVLVEIYAFEVNYDKAFGGVVEELTYCNLAVLNVFLLHEA